MERVAAKYVFDTKRSIPDPCSDEANLGIMHIIHTH